MLYKCLIVDWNFGVTSALIKWGRFIMPFWACVTTKGEKMSNSPLMWSMLLCIVAFWCVGARWVAKFQVGSSPDISPQFTYNAKCCHEKWTPQYDMETI